MDTLLYFQSTATTSAMRKLDGVSQAAKERGWLVARFDLHDPRQIHDEILAWTPVGCVVEFATDDISLPQRTLGLVPTVLLDCNPSLARRNVSTVVQHPVSIGAFAAEHLLGMDLAAYAYVGWAERKFWDRMRRGAFTRAVRAAGRPCFQIDPGKGPASIGTLRARIAAGIAPLPKPVGIYCANDAMAAQVLEAANGAGLSVPNDIALLGTDNEEHICENSVPTLSSVELDFAGAGRRCVDIIAERTGTGEAAVHETFGPLRIVRRSSTRRSPRLDRCVVVALDMIRARATSGLSPREVAAAFPCSRRMAEMRFRAATGHSILDEIHDVQIEHAKRILETTHAKVSMVPSMCGYESNPFFMALFRRKTGRPMHEWRNLGAARAKGGGARGAGAGTE